MTRFQNLKTLALTIFILLGGLAHGHRAQAMGTDTLVVAGGCFWCVESDFESVPGVRGVVSGYTGGSTKNPSYKDVTKGGSGHYEAVKITFDPDTVTRETLLNLFFRSVDPTDAGGQFCDRGDSYRSAIFVANKVEQGLADSAKAKAQAQLGQTIVTPILKEGKFYKAEAYHQDYYKGSKIVLTRFGPKKQSEAYKRYRKACGRDARVKALWGSDAPFVGH
ncbi:peptide-methionine (S)-S-oxide reductase MsrA [Shimia sagamensis]|uniref:Peptide methionine sulfoxide reductase MsrA n=1 Tax=Shimia sagamensis TaxID=1566352 RepID=A0ABY1NBC5_9RHOB|nr:peptide-methionine (S)-S-oxide reductase MsrA [Shimia sagamensis]SMP05439.1 peptide-methionine (S)-S-oxide reductase [Shimia sagamensis]